MGFGICRIWFEDKGLGHSLKLQGSILAADVI